LDSSLLILHFPLKELTIWTLEREEKLWTLDFFGGQHLLEWILLDILLESLLYFILSLDWIDSFDILWWSVWHSFGHVTPLWQWTDKSPKDQLGHSLVLDGHLEIIGDVTRDIHDDWAWHLWHFGMTVTKLKSLWDSWLQFLAPVCGCLLTTQNGITKFLWWIMKHPDEQLLIEVFNLYTKVVGSDNGWFLFLYCKDLCGGSITSKNSQSKAITCWHVTFGDTRDVRDVLDAWHLWQWQSWLTTTLIMLYC
jgi:hypothetical protein